MLTPLYENPLIREKLDVVPLIHDKPDVVPLILGELDVTPPYSSEIQGKGSHQCTVLVWKNTSKTNTLNTSLSILKEKTPRENKTMVVLTNTGVTM